MTATSHLCSRLPDRAASTRWTVVLMVPLTPVAHRLPGLCKGLRAHGGLPMRSYGQAGDLPVLAA
jgi:hypothetical protein